MIASVVSLSTLFGAAIGIVGPSVGIGLIAVLIGAGALAMFVKDPVAAMLMLWAYEVIRLALASLVGYEGSRGQLVLQADNYVIAVLFVALFWQAATRDSSLNRLKFALPGLLIVVIGLVSDVINHVSLNVAAIGMWQGVRIWLLLAIACLVPWTRSDHERIYGFLVGVGLAISFFGVVDLAARNTFRHFLHTDTVSLALGDYRYSAAVESIFTTPAKLSLCMSLLFGLTLTSYVTRRRSRDLVVAVIFAITAVLSLRLQAVLSVGTVILVVSLFSARVRGTVVLMMLVVSLSLGVLVYTIAGEAVQRQVSTYTSSGATARSLLYMGGERIARNDFPLGSGFGTYGSSASRKYYSRLYGEYGLGQVYGLSRQYPQFIDDTSWPSVMAETGYLGLACYIVGLLTLGLLLVREVRRTARSSSYLPLASLCALVVIVLQSVASPTLFDGFAAVTFALLVGPALMSTGHGIQQAS